MATVYWEGDTSTDSSVGSNWSSGSVPGSGDDVIFDSSASGDCVLGQNHTFQSLDIQASWARSLTTNGYGITTSGSQNWDGTAAASFTFTDGDDLKITGDANFTVGVSGDATVSSGQPDVILEGTGNYQVDMTSWNAKRLTCAASGKTTTLNGSKQTRSDALTLGSGTFNLTTKTYPVWCSDDSSLTFDTSHSVTGNQKIELRNNQSGYADLTIPRINASSTNDILLLANDGDSGGFTLSGPITCGTLFLTNNKGDTANNVFDLNDQNVTCQEISFGSNSAGDRMNIAFGSGTIDCAGDFWAEEDAGDTYIDFESATIYIGGSITLGTNTTVSSVGTAFIEMDGATAETITSAGEDLPDLEFNKSGGGITLLDALSCGDLTITEGSTNTGGYAVECNDLSVPSTADTKTWTNSVWTVNGDAETWDSLQFYRLIFSGTFTIDVGDEVQVDTYTSGDINGSTWLSDDPGNQALVDFPDAGITVLNTTWTDINANNGGEIDATDASNTDGGNNDNIDFGSSSQTVTATGIASAEAFGTASVNPGNVDLAPTGIASAEAFGTASLTTGNVNVSPSGIASAEAFGTATLVAGGVSITGVGDIASAEAFGTAILTTGNVNVSPSSITSAEAFGTATLTTSTTVQPTGITSAEAFGTLTLAPGGVSVSPTGIASAEAFGSATVNPGNVNLSPSGVASAEAFGSPLVAVGNVVVEPSGIASAEAFGTATLVAGGVTVSGVGDIASGEAFGTASVVPGNVNVSPTGIASEEAFGTADVKAAGMLYPTGITSAEAFGTASVVPGNVNLAPSSITSAEAFGTPSVVYIIEPTSITTQEAFGTPMMLLDIIVYPSSITSGETFGTTTIQPGNVDVQPSSISSAEAFGTPSIDIGGVVVGDVGNIASAEAFGNATLTTGGVAVQPSGIPSGEAFGTPTMVHIVEPTGIVSGESFGTSTVVPGTANIFPSSITSAEAFGTATIAVGAITVDPVGISSSEAFGTPSLVLGGVTIQAQGIPSSESFGSPTVSPGNVFLTPTGIASGEAFGNATVVPTFSISGVGNIASAEAFGTLVIVTGGTDIGVFGIASVEAFGIPFVQQEGVIRPVGIDSEEVFGTPHFLFDVIISVPSIPSAEAFGTLTVVPTLLSEYEQMFNNDLDEVFFVNPEFAVKATYIYRSGQTQQILGIFDTPYIELNPDAGMGVQSRELRFLVAEKNFRWRPQNGDQIIVRGRRFNVIVPEHDGVGLTEIMLHNQ